jgi:aconitate hydratase
VPLELTGGDTVQSLGITGREVIEIAGLASSIASTAGRAGGGGAREVTVLAVPEPDAQAHANAQAQAGDSGGVGGGGGRPIEFKARVRLDTPQEVQYYRHGGILHYVLRQLLKQD